MKIQEGNKVKLHYEGKLDDGTVFDTSYGREPLVVTMGEKQVIEGFENALANRDFENNGNSDKFEVQIPKDQAYGDFSNERVHEVKLEQLPEEGRKVGATLNANTDGKTLFCTVQEINEESNLAKLDFNHPLAGKNLTFKIEILEVI
jgi:peptidylprolyl isomerase